MSSDKSFVDFITDQISNAGTISSKKMFGEYALYCEGKVVALICDNQLFVKPTSGGKEFIGDVVEAPPYPGAKMSFLIEDKFEDREWLSELIRITFRELPEPKPKTKTKINSGTKRKTKGNCIDNSDSEALSKAEIKKTKKIK
ncbi:MAG: TfoX/Sxy family protein [Candidatus Wallbacteria bacterium]